METYRITILVTKEEADDTPDRWDWQALCDSAYPVVVESCEEVEAA